MLMPSHCHAPTQHAIETHNLYFHIIRYLSDINVVPALVIVGIFSATLSAALSCLIGASRIIQAIARDRLLGDWYVHMLAFASV